MDSKQRFSSRVDAYVKYRPGYPKGVVETLHDACGLLPSSVIADVGSGTGLLARLFLDFGCTVFGIEPNAEMRAAGERLLANDHTFTSLNGSAEATGMPAASADFVTAGQAFHWFNPALAREEFRRILTPDGWVVLVWNERRLDSTPFLRAYEDMLERYGTDYKQINHRNVEEDPQVIPAFFGGPYEMACFEYVQMFGFDGVRGRLESSSYVPEAGHPDYHPMLAELQRIFDQYQKDGVVAIEYDTRMFYGKIQG
jgi:SAM-dependent methyltransferase